MYMEFKTRLSFPAVVNQSLDSLLCHVMLWICLLKKSYAVPVMPLLNMPVPCLQ